MMERPFKFGFTLIELLITVVLFSLVMTSLMIGLHTGVNSWKRIRAHQDFMAEAERALDIIAQDLRHLVRVSEDIPVIVESEKTASGTNLDFTATIPNSHHDQGRGAVWAKIQYMLVEDEEVIHENTYKLNRVWAPQIASSTIINGEQEHTLLSELSSVEYHYLGQEGLVSEWGDSEQIPIAIVIQLHFDSGKTLERTVSIPVGMPL